MSIGCLMYSNRYYANPIGHTIGNSTRLCRRKGTTKLAMFCLHLRAACVAIAVYHVYEFRFANNQPNVDMSVDGMCSSDLFKLRAHTKQDHRRQHKRNVRKTSLISTQHTEMASQKIQAEMVFSIFRCCFDNLFRIYYAAAVLTNDVCVCVCVPDMGSCFHLNWNQVFILRAQRISYRPKTNSGIFPHFFFSRILWSRQLGSNSNEMDREIHTIHFYVSVLPLFIVCIFEVAQ